MPWFSGAHGVKVLKWSISGLQLVQSKYGKYRPEKHRFGHFLRSGEA